jgi:DNA polymerase-3 subunit gamma/tau
VFQALYRKWRPRVFEDVVGQPQVTKTLLNELRTGAVGHAYLFTGSRGTGKTSCAKILSKAVNCLDPKDGDPCGECEICRGIDSGAVLDVVEIDAASNNGVDNIRALRDETAFSPARAKYRVYIIDEVHMLSAGAFNALLKTLEEPPAYVIFILATTEVQRIPATILSRCQRFDFRRIPAEEIAARLQYIAGEENISLTHEAALLIARISDGAMRDALSLLEKCAGLGSAVGEDTVAKAAGLSDRKYLHELASGIAAGDFSRVLGVIDGLYSQSKDMELTCVELIDHFRMMMLLKTSPAGPPDCTPGELVLLRSEEPSFTLEAVLHVLDSLSVMLETLRRSASPRVEMEMCLLRLCRPELDDSPKALARRISALESMAAGARLRAPAEQPEPLRQPQPSPEDKAENPDAPASPGPEPAAAAAPAEENASPQSTAPPQTDTAQPAQPPAPKRGEKPGADEPLASWPDAVAKLAASDPPLGGVLRGSEAVIHGGFVLIDSSNAMFSQLIRRADHQKALIDAIAAVTGRQYKVGILKKTLDLSRESGDPLEELMKNASAGGVDISEK